MRDRCFCLKRTHASSSFWTFVVATSLLERCSRLQAPPVSKKQAQTEFRGGGAQEFSALHQQDGEGGGNLSFFLWQHSIPAGESQ